MPGYEVTDCNPPAPVARVSLRNGELDGPELEWSEHSPERP